VATYRNSNVDKLTEEGEVPVRLCNYTDVYYHNRISATLNFMDATATPEEIAEFGLRKGDVIITKDSESPDDIGIPALVEADLPGVLCGYHLTRIRAGSEVAPEYLYYTLTSGVARGHFEVEAKGVTRHSLGQEGIGTLLMRLTGLNEQHAIAAYLDRETARIDALVAAKERQIVCLTEAVEGEREELVRRGVHARSALTASGLDWRGPAPSQWRHMRLKHVLEQVVRPVEVHPELDYREIGVRSHGRGVFHKNPIPGAWLEEKQVFSVVDNCLVFNIVFAWEGAVAITTEAEREMIASHRFPLFRSRGDACDVRYLKHLFASGVGRPLLEFHSPGAAGRNKTLSQARLLGEWVPLPPVEEQSAIADRIEAMTVARFKARNKLECSVSLLRERRQALITHAVTGNLRIPVEAIHA
jgi:type I restriction enzyme S subunit